MTGSEGVEEGALLRAGALTRDHHGWLVRFATPPGAAATIVLGGVRLWTYDGTERAGLLGLESGSVWRGTEYHMAADTEVRLERHVKRGVPRARKGDYPAAPAPSPRDTDLPDDEE